MFQTILPISLRGTGVEPTISFRDNERRGPQPSQMTQWVKTVQTGLGTLETIPRRRDETLLSVSLWELESWQCIHNHPMKLCGHVKKIRLVTSELATESMLKSPPGDRIFGSFLNLRERGMISKRESGESWRNLHLWIFTPNPRDHPGHRLLPSRLCNRGWSPSLQGGHPSGWKL